MSAPDLAFEKGLPANPDAERFVLGSILLNDAVWHQVADELDTDDFSLEKHRRIFARMKDLIARGEHVDRVTLPNELIKHGQLESVDGLSYLISLDEGLPTLTNLDAYIRIVKDKALLRSMIFDAQKLINRCLLGEDEPGDILGGAHAQLTRRLDGASKKTEWMTPGQVMRVQGVDAVLFPSKSGAGLKTPWPKLTDMTSGWQPGELNIAAGRPGMGKSVYAMQQARETAKETGVAYFSLEMSREALIRRLVAGIARVDAHRARRGQVTAEERRRMLEAANDIEELPLHIDAMHTYTPTAMGYAVRKLRSKMPIGLVIIDHLQLMRSGNRGETRHQELSETCHFLKRLAGELECVVLVLSQLNRACETERRPPILSDLRESGSIEEDADSVIFIHRPEVYKPDDPSLRGKASFIVAKQRSGPTGTLHMTFLREFQLFEEAAREKEQP
jgi:replicative DNA helicase